MHNSLELRTQILNLYSLQRISVTEWKHSEEMIVQPLGEFELSWCLSELPETYLDMDYFTVTKLDREFSFAVTREGRQNRISMTDFNIEVVR